MSSGDKSKPDFQVKVDGSPISDDIVAAVIQITVDDALNAAAVATIKLRDDYSQVSDDHPFELGAAIEICLGYVGDANTAVFHGEITGYRGAFVRRGNQTLTIVSHDKFHRLRRNRRSKTYLSAKDSDVISQAASAAGLSTDVEATPLTQDAIIQLNQTDADFILERAGLFGYEVYVDDGKLVARKPKLSAGAVTTLIWHEELRHFSVAIDLSQQQKEVKVQAWDMTNKQLVTASAKTGKERDLMGGTQPGAKAVASVDGAEPKVQISTPAHNQDEVQAYVDAQFAKASETFLLGDGTCEGDPKIRRGTVVEVDEIGNYLSGNYYVRRAIHTLLPSSGYTTTFKVLRTAVQRPGTAPSYDMPEPIEQEPFEVAPDGDPLTFKVGDSAGAPLGGVPFVIVDPTGKRQSGQLSSDGQVDVEFEEGG